MTKTQRSKVRVFEGTVYRIFAIFKPKSSSGKENGKMERNDENITKSENNSQGKFHTLKFLGGYFLSFPYKYINNLFTG